MSNTDFDFEALVDEVEGPGPVDDPGPELAPMSPRDLQSFVTQSIDRAVDFMESEISERQNTAQRYYDGGSAIKSEPGRSKVTITKVREAVRNVMPSIMRAFYTAPVVGQYEPRNPWDEQMAKSATEVVDSILDAAGGYKIMLEASHDAMFPRCGFVTWGWEVKQRPVFTQYSNVSEMEIAALEQDGEAIVTERSESNVVDSATGEPLYEITVRRLASEGKLYIDSIAPETTFVDRNATCIEDSRVFGFQKNRPRSDLHEMGIPEWRTRNLSEGEQDPMNEREARQGYSPEHENQPQDPSSREVLVTEVWIRVDADGDGIAELRRMLCAGTKHEILLDEPVDDIDVAAFRTEIEPHTFFPVALSEMMVPDQDAATSLLRAIIDNAHAVNNPRLEIDENNANVEDAMNGEIGALVRVRRMNSIREIVTSPNGMGTLSVLQYMDQQGQAKTGTSNAALGLDPDALQSTTQKGVEATISTATAMIELMTRNIAETGISRVMRGLLKTIIRNSPQSFWVRIDDQFQQVNPRFWHAEVNVSVNVGLGNGQPAEKLGALQMVAAKQEEILRTYGASNPFNITYENWRNSMRSMLKLVGIHNLSDFFPPADQQQIVQYEQQAAQNAPDPNAAAKEIAGITAQGRVTETQIRAHADMVKSARDDDRQRDADAMDFFVDTAKLGMEPSIENLEQEVNKPRP